MSRIGSRPAPAIRFDSKKPPPTGSNRGDLWALVSRALLLDLVELGEIGEHDGARCFGVGSAGSFYPMANADEVERADINQFINMRTFKHRI